MSGLGAACHHALPLLPLQAARAQHRPPHARVVVPLLAHPDPNLAPTRRIRRSHAGALHSVAEGGAGTGGGSGWGGRGWWAVVALAVRLVPAGLWGILRLAAPWTLALQSIATILSSSSSSAGNSSSSSNNTNTSSDADFDTALTRLLDMDVARLVPLLIRREKPRGSDHDAQRAPRAPAPGASSNRFWTGSRAGSEFCVSPASLFFLASFSSPVFVSAPTHTATPTPAYTHTPPSNSNSAPETENESRRRSARLKLTAHAKLLIAFADAVVEWAWVAGHLVDFSSLFSVLSCSCSCSCCALCRWNEWGRWRRSRRPSCARFSRALTPVDAGGATMRFVPSHQHTLYFFRAVAEPMLTVGTQLRRDQTDYSDALRHLACFHDSKPGCSAGAGELVMNCKYVFERNVRNFYLRCGHPDNLPPIEVKCTSTHCKFSPNHPSSCVPSSCRQRCNQYHLFPEQYTPH
ncbi:hypothetical protein C8R45DRAFT_1175567, partial [Mycena sanguinolenta]